MNRGKETKFLPRLPVWRRHWLLFLVPQVVRQRTAFCLLQKVVQFQIGASAFGEVLAVGFPERSDTSVAVFCARLAVIITTAVVEPWLSSHLCFVLL